MKLAHLFAALTLSPVCGCNAQQSDSIHFRAQRISRTAAIELNAPVEKVFPLFGAFEERKWDKEWNPTLIYPESEVIMEGTTFKTPGHGHGEAELLWCVTRYEPEQYLLQYLITSPNRYWTITIRCRAANGKTDAEITYTFIGLNALGNEIDRRWLDHIYRDNLNDWKDAINGCLPQPATGR